MTTETTQREKLNWTVDDIPELASGYAPEGFEIVQNEITDTSRWSTIYTITVKRASDGKFFQDTYRRGATECQEERPWEYTDPDFTEVFPVEKTVIVYQ